MPTVRLHGRTLVIGRRETTRGDGLAWWIYGLWITGAHGTAAIGSERHFTLEWSAGARGRTRQKHLNDEGYFR